MSYEKSLLSSHYDDALTLLNSLTDTLCVKQLALQSDSMEILKENVSKDFMLKQTKYLRVLFELIQVYEQRLIEIWDLSDHD